MTQVDVSGRLTLKSQFRDFLVFFLKSLKEFATNKLIIRAAYVQDWFGQKYLFIFDSLK